MSLRVLTKFAVIWSIWWLKFSKNANMYKQILMIFLYKYKAITYLKSKKVKNFWETTPPLLALNSSNNLANDKNPEKSITIQENLKWVRTLPYPDEFLFVRDVTGITHSNLKSSNFFLCLAIFLALVRCPQLS